MTQVAKALERLRPWLPLRENASFSGAFDAVYSGAHADVVTLWQDASSREQKFEEQKQDLDEEWGAQAKDNRLQVVPEDIQRQSFNLLYEKVRELESEKAQLEAALAREERKSELLTDKVEEWKASSDHWQERAKAAERERDEARRALVEKEDEAVSECHRAYRERDEWKARAEAAERDRNEAQMERSDALEELSKARTAPAVSRADIEKVVADWVDDAPEIVNEVWSLVSGDDPAVYVVRESNVEAQAALRNRFGEFVVNGTVLNVTTAEDCREKAQRHLDAAARCEALARAIEAEQAVDPVETLAEEFARTLAEDENIGGSWSMDPAAWRDITRTLARRAHAVLGQEAGDE